jgi:hypothetical protein
VNTTPPQANQILILMARGSVWHGLVATPEGPGRVRVDETMTFTGGEQDIRSWIETRDLATVRIVLPACHVICRTCSLPESDEAQLEAALQLQIETRILGAAPPHRFSGAMLPAASHSTTRTGLILAWPESSVFTGPTLDAEPFYVPDIAALASLLGRLHPPDPIVWCDRNNGSVGLVLAQQEQVLVRATREQLGDDEGMKNCIKQLLLESALQTGSSPDNAAALAQRSVSSLAARSDRDQMLLLPETVQQDLRERITGVELDADWLQDWGIAVGAALATTEDLVLLTTFRQSLPEERPSFVEATTTRLKMRNVATALVIAAVLLLAFGPLLIHGFRLAVLSVLHPSIDEQVRAFEDGRNRQTMYRAMLDESWPMSKILGDISNNTPQGIELEVIKISHGEPVKIGGIAKPDSGDDAAALATKMKAQLQGSGVFSDVTLRWEDEKTYGDREFDISANVVRPHYRPAYAMEQDFGSWTLSARRSGEGPEGEELDGDVNVATATSTPSIPAAPRLPQGTTPSIPGSVTGSPGPATSTRTASADSGDSSANGRSSSGRTSRPSGRSSGDGFSSRSDSDSQGADLSSIPTGRIPESLSQEQISTMTLAEANIKLKEVANARKHVRDEAVSERLRNEFKMIMAHIRDLKRNEGSQ